PVAFVVLESRSYHRTLVGHAERVGSNAVNRGANLGESLVADPLISHSPLPAHWSNGLETDSNLPLARYFISDEPFGNPHQIGFPSVPCPMWSQCYPDRATSSVPVGYSKAHTSSSLGAPYGQVKSKTCTLATTYSQISPSLKIQTHQMCAGA